MNDLRPLEFALALDQYRNFGRAAETMGVTQPSFSRAIAALEAQLGARLFDRSNRGVEPTPSGVALLARARRLLADAASLSEAQDDYQNLRSGRIAIGVGPYALDLSVIECVVRLARQHPLLQIELVEGRWHDFSARLLSGEVEVAVMEIGPLALDARLRVEVLPPHQGLLLPQRPPFDPSHVPGPGRDRRVPTGRRAHCAACGDCRQAESPPAAAGPGVGQPGPAHRHVFDRCGAFDHQAHRRHRHRHAGATERRPASRRGRDPRCRRHR
jgi:DNA-binding transcriptional LysR family regulator